LPADIFRRRDLLAWYVACSAGLIGRAAAQDAAKVTAPIQRFYAGLLSVMQAGRTTPFVQRFDTLSPILEQAINVPAILQSAVGIGWAAIPAQQQSVLLTAFTRYTVSTWVENFDSYSGQKLEVKGVRSMGSAQVVRTEIVKQSGSPSVIDYVMRPADAGWKATDVLLDGSISQVAVLRSDFRSLLARGPLALAAHLEQKSTELTGGTSPI
jgi:phospholipid transport system substrate-binding protein